MPQKNFIEELRWRNMLSYAMPGTEELLGSGMVTGYIGFDPTADSLGIGNMVQVMTLLHFQRCGHKPVALVGGATGMVGDPSGKSTERNLLDEDTLRHNLECQKKQLEKFLDFDCGANSAEIVNNYDWFKDMSFLDFLRDVGKHITVNYMKAKDSVKNRIEGDEKGEKEGMSFTEFAYQLVQGYDFYWLWKHRNVKLQMGGSDQFGNITTGTELIRRKGHGEAWAVTTQLITKADGTKFGKTEKGNIWLDAAKTSERDFYQFWINASDEDAASYIKIFSMLGREEIEALLAEHNKNREARILQKQLARELTTRVHSEAIYNDIVKGSEQLRELRSREDLVNLSKRGDFLDIISGASAGIYNVGSSALREPVHLAELVSTLAPIFKSKSEAKKFIQGGGLSVNMEKVTDPGLAIGEQYRLPNSYILIKKGRKDFYFLNILD